MQLHKNNISTNARIFEQLAKIREQKIDDVNYQSRREALAKMSDAQLAEITPSADAFDNRLVGDEILWREVNEQLKK